MGGAFVGAWSIVQEESATRDQGDSRICLESNGKFYMRLPFFFTYFFPGVSMHDAVGRTFCCHNSKMELKYVFPMSFMLTKDGLAI